MHVRFITDGIDESISGYLWDGSLLQGTLIKRSIFVNNNKG
jgi:hypothetical protein